MDDEVLELHRRSLAQACTLMGISVDRLLESAGGRWYVTRMGQELQEAQPPIDVSLAVSNTVEVAADLPAEQRRMAQGVGTAQLLVLLGLEPSS